MSTLEVTPWRRFQHDRLYVNLPDGQNVAWFDLRTQQLEIKLEAHRDAALDALAAYLAQRPDLPGLALPPSASSPPADPWPTPPALGQPTAGWTPEIPEQPAAKPAVPPTAAPRSEPPSSGTSAALGPAGAPPHPTNALDPADDLARNPPGAALRAKIKELTPGFWRALLNWLLSRPSEDLSSWHKGLVGEQTAANELQRLTPWGWRILHSLPLAEEVDLDHLLVGPGGVFTINTKYLPEADVWVGDQEIWVRGQATKYLRKAWAEANRVSAILSQACGFTVRAEPVLAFVAVRKLVLAPPRDNARSRQVRAIHCAEFVTFAGLPEVWSPAHVERIYTAARDRRNWPRA